MATLAQNQFQQLLISQNGVGLTSGGIDNLNQGEVGIFSPDGTRLTDSNVGNFSRFMLAQGRGNEPVMLSDVIDVNEVSDVRVKTSDAEQEQIDYVGFSPNTGSGSIDTIDDNFYYLRINLGQHITSNHGGIYVKGGQYHSDSSTTQEEVALNTAKNIFANFSREPEEIIRPGAVNDAGVTVADDLDNDATFTKGSNKVGVSGGGYSSGNSNGTLAAGDYIRVEGDGATVTNASTVYRVESTDFSNNEFTIDRPFEGDDVVITGDDSAGIQVLSSSNAGNSIGSNWGIKVQGVGRNYKRLKFPRDPYNQVSFDLNMDGFGTTDHDQAQSASTGSGQFEEVADLESFVQGNIGEFMRVGEPNIHDQLEITSRADAPYYMVHIVFKQKETIGFNDQISRKVVTWAVGVGDQGSPSVPAHADYTNGSDNVSDVLEDLIGSEVTSSENFTNIS